MGIFFLACLALIYVFSIQIFPVVDKITQNDTPKILPLITDKEISRGSTEKKQVIFTFDAGSGDVSTRKILSVLKDYGVKGTFFVTGQFAERYPDLVREILAGGHEIYNHTYSHPHLTEISDEEIGDELLKMENALQKSGNTTSRPYFRPPYGDRDERVLAAAYKNGYQSVYWSVDAGDWMAEGITAGEVKERILSNIYPGAIFLMHVGDAITGDILGEILSDIEARGFRAVSLSEGL
jgi:peptidoglycan/xylan/chitin deacetylase (PgdA/CDA1 family)